MRKLIKDKIIEIEQNSSDLKVVPGKLSIWIKTKSNKDIYDFLMNDPNNFGDNFLQRLYNIRYDITELPKCGVCGNPVNEFIGYNKGYKETCCRTCTNILKYGVEHPMQSKQVQDNLKATMIEKFGVENAYQSEEIKEKIKKTNIERHGAANPQQCKEIHEKTKKTNLKKFGSEFPLGSSIIRKKIEQTNIEKYGNKSPLGNKDIREQINKTNQERYGGNSPMNSEEIKERHRQNYLENTGYETPLLNPKIRKIIEETNIRKFGAKTPLESEFIRNKCEETLKTNLGVSHYCSSKAYRVKYFNKFKDKIKDYVIPLFDENEYDGLLSDKVLAWKCVKCGNEFKQALNGPRLQFTDFQYIPRCWHCYPHLTNTSLAENELYEFCSKYFNDVKRNDKDLIGIDLDLIIPSIRLAIEFDGIYYHSTAFKKPGLHLEKVKKCNEKGYRLIHIWEDEWIEHKDDILAKLEKIFKNEEDLTFTDEEVILDRSWFNNVAVPNYQIIGETAPAIIKRMKFDIEDCGNLIFKREK